MQLPISVLSTMRKKDNVVNIKDERHFIIYKYSFPWVVWPNQSKEAVGV